jgi:hypothetical protein
MVIHHVVARKVSPGEELAKAAINVQENAAASFSLCQESLVNAGCANANDALAFEFEKSGFENVDGLRAEQKLGLAFPLTRRF